MAAAVENSFGARLARAQKMSGYIGNFQNYAPPRYEESVQGFTEFVNQVTLLNDEETSLEQQYNLAVKTRESLFYKDANCVIKLLTMIRGAAEAQYGKTSIEFQQIDTLVRQMRDNRPAVKAATATTPESKISQSERSYGSITQYFGDLVTILNHLPAYNASNPALQIPQLQALVAQMRQLNTEIPSRYQQLTDRRDRRRAAYKELRDRVNRIKAYCKANYGLNSSEYKLVKSISM